MRGTDRRWGVLSGGVSPEREISLSSGRYIAARMRVPAITAQASISGPVVSQPAVSQPNGKVSAGAGAITDDFSAVGEGSLSLPIDRDWCVIVGWRS